jgi:YD repeat-containing protein
MNISIPEKINVHPAYLPRVAQPEIKVAAGASLSDVQLKSESPVFLSGRGLMMSRLFKGHAVEPATVAYDPNLSTLFPTLFLLPEDRDLLSAVYEFANVEGADLAYVDDLAWSIAYYRKSDNGREIIPQRPLKRFDTEGHEVSYSFNEESARTAHRILNGSAVSTTVVDRGFLRFALDVDYSPMSSLNFRFLEQIVSKFSDKGEVVSDFGRQFDHFALDHKNWIKNVSEQTYDLSTGVPFLKGTPPDSGAALATRESAAETAPINREPSRSLREIIAAYLKETDVPTLFETLMRMKR